MKPKLHFERVGGHRGRRQPMMPIMRVGNERVLPLELVARHPLSRRGQGITVPGSGLTVPGSGLTVPGTGLIVPGTGLIVPGTMVTRGTGLVVPGGSIFGAIGSFLKQIVKSPLVKKGLKAGVKTLRNVATPAIKNAIKNSDKLNQFSGLSDKGLDFLNNMAEKKGYGAAPKNMVLPRNPDGSYGHGPAKMFIKTGRPSKPMTPRQRQQLQEGEGFLGDLATSAISSIGGLLIDKIGKLGGKKKRGRGMLGSGGATKGIALKPSQYGKDNSNTAMDKHSFRTFNGYAESAPIRGSGLLPL